MSCRCPGWGGPLTAANIPHYVPKCCPTPTNNDPKQWSPYCKQTPSLSQPLSHYEYLKKKKANGFAPLSAKAALTQVGNVSSIGLYTTTIWTETNNNGVCCPSTIAHMLVPAVYPGGSAKDAGVTTTERKAFAGRGTTSVLDTTNHIESITTLRRQGYAVAGDLTFNAPAGGFRTPCATCTLAGTSNTVHIGQSGCTCAYLQPNY